LNDLGPLDCRLSNQGGRRFESVRRAMSERESGRGLLERA
jgi:hypothetical protein